jgi:adenine phosphoribosyltransferase
MNLQNFIRDIPDFPKQGIIFKDITPLLNDPQAFAESVRLMSVSAEKYKVTQVVGIESRGFIFGSAVAMKLGVGFVPVRKPGKLPAATFRETYTLEYGTDAIEMHQDALTKDDNVLLVDDLLATGGTMLAAIRLVEQTGAKVAKVIFLIELAFLNGREKLKGYDITSLLTF